LAASSNRRPHSRNLRARPGHDAKEKGVNSARADPDPAPAKEARKRLEAGETQRVSRAAYNVSLVRFRDV